MKTGFSNRRMIRAIAARVPAPVQARFSGLFDWVDLYLIDHGFIRSVYGNRHRLACDAWRASQPSPGHIAWYARQGVKTIVNLRGARGCGSYRLERRACEARDIDLVDFRMRSRGAPSREQLAEARTLIETMAYPAMVHCKSGADRVGVFATLFLIARGAPVREARKQLSLRYGHIRQGKTGVLDAVFDAYEAQGAAEGLDFWTWAAQVYDPAKVQAEFRSSRLGNFLVDRVLARE